MRWPLAGDGRRSGALFGAQVGSVGGTHSTCCRERFPMHCGRGRWPPCSLRLLHV